MEIEFAGAGREIFEDAGESRGGHATSVAQAEDVIGGADAAELTRGIGAEGAEDLCERCVIGGFADEAHAIESACGQFGNRESKNRRMQMQMGVAVEMAGRKTELGEAPELRGDLARQRCAGARIEGVAQAGGGGRFHETTARVGERGDFAREAVAKREVQPDAERGIALRDAYGFIGARFIHHEAGVREQAGAVMALDGFIHGVAAAEIVACEDEAPCRSVFSIQFSVFSFRARVAFTEY